MSIVNCTLLIRIYIYKNITQLSNIALILNSVKIEYFLEIKLYDYKNKTQKISAGSGIITGT